MGFRRASPFSPDEFFGEARVNWIFNGSGTNTLVGFTESTWTPLTVPGQGGLAQLGAGGIHILSATWQQLTEVTPEDTAGPTANDVAGRYIFEPDQGP